MTGRANFLTVAVIAASTILAANLVRAEEEEIDHGPRTPPPELPAATLKDPDVIAVGEKLWVEQCTHCHGAKAYPGKAPKLKPRLYKPDFVWDRVHNGFRQMPPWREVYKAEEIVALVAYVLSDDFFP